jgi:fucose permease
MEVGVPPVEHLAMSAAMLGAAVLAAWPALLPTMPAPAGGPFFVLPRGRLAVLGAVALVAFMAEGAMGDWSAIYIRMDLGASPATAAYGFAAFSLTMAIGRLTGDGLVARFSPAAIIVAGALVGAAALAAALIAGHPAAAVLGFAGMGLGLANVAPIVFSAAGRMPDLAPGIGIAAVSTAGYCGFLAGPPLIGLVAEVSSLTAGLGLVAGVVGLMVLGTGALPRRQSHVVALAG